jgi:hypothetical protein
LGRPTHLLQHVDSVRACRTAAASCTPVSYDAQSRCYAQSSTAFTASRPPSTLPAPHARHCSPVLSGLPQWPRAPSLVRCACSAAPLRLSGLQTLSATRRPWVQRCVNGRLGSVTMRVGHLSSHSSAGWAGREWRESHLLHARVGAQLGRHKRDHVSMVGIPTASSTLTVVASTPGRLRTHGIL